MRSLGEAAVPTPPQLVPAGETDDGPRQVPDFAPDRLVGAHSCGHSAGFSPASLWTAPGPTSHRRAAPWSAPLLGKLAAGCQIPRCAV